MSGADVLVNGVGAVWGVLLWRAVAPLFGAPEATPLSASTE
jgi:hypothetical protein